ncbi:MAG: hypothetical protein HY699_19855 [Deltaproteobacteria bacterium]|nr:hypothetical protein [Deltaproteobacteria bacterium]
MGDPTTMQIPLAWDAVPGATGYILERSLSCDFSPTSTVAVDEMGVNSGTLIGGYTLGVPGALGSDSNTALLLNGSTGLVNLGNHASIDITYRQNGLTLEAWLSAPWFGPYSTIVGKSRNASATNYGFDIGEGRLFRYWTGDGGWNTQTWDFPLATNTWYHVVLTHRTDGTVYLWLNGARQAMRVNTSTPIKSPDPAAIGSQTGLAPAWPFSGSLDEVAIYDHALADARIEAHYNSRDSGNYSAEVLADAPVAYWRLGDHGGPTSINLSAAATAYGDTGREPDDKCRFFVDNGPCPLQPGSPRLRAEVTYNYRVRAQHPNGELISDCVSAQLGTAPIRGLAGDLWADVVLGKPDFGQNAAVLPLVNWTERPAGVLIDKRQANGPSRVYIADANHNRIIGFDHIGRCGDAAPCTVDGDCVSGACALDPSTLLPSIVLGQPDFTGTSACNGDGTGQLFPGRAPASASSLCLIPPLQISIAEVVYGSLMDTDDNGALYVPDVFNNRVLRYDDPFNSANTAAADAVIGQSDFAENVCNRGLPAGAPIDCAMLCLEGDRHAGVAIDDEGNLWVADVGNYRVLRFPKCPRNNSSVCSGVPAGEHAKQADVVLGQPDCASRSQSGTGRGLTQFFQPLDVAFDRQSRTLYVADAGDWGWIPSRLLKFTPQAGDFTTGMSGAAIPISPPQQFPGTPPQLCAPRPIEITLDTSPDGLWVRYDADVCVERVNTATGQPSLRISQFGGPMRGVEVDRSGNLFVLDTFDYLFRFGRPALESVLEAQRAGLREPVFVQPAAGWFSASWTQSSKGVAVLSDPSGNGGDQLINADWNRLLIYNNWDASTAQSGAAADDLFGEPSFTSSSQWPHQQFGFPQAVGNQLWVTRGTNSATDLLVFSYPVSNSSTPAVIPLTVRPGFDGFPVLGCPGAAYCNCAGQGCNGNRIYASGRPLDFAVHAAADEAWVADRWNHRVFRIRNITNPAQRFVDVVLGQPSLAQTQGNQGGSLPRADTLFTPYSVATDANGNVYVTDNGEEGGTNNRMLEFDGALFDTSAGALFGVPASRVFGADGDFNVNGFSATRDPYISPFEAILHPLGPMTVASNPYPNTQRFPLVYLNPLAESLPQLMLGDMTSYPDASGAVDNYGNLYIADNNWGRVLVYRNPFQSALGSPPPTPTGPTPTPTPSLTRTPTRTRTPTPPPPICGNGARELGEECDDGNTTSGDGCSSTCTYERIPGNGSGSVMTDRRACLLEWSVVNPNNVPALDSRGRPNSNQSCRNNDSSCDFDLDSNNRTCEFRVVACLNNTDPNLPTCPQLGVANSIRVLLPNALRDPINYSSLTTALQSLRDATTGETLSLPVDFSRTNVCTEPFAIRVPLLGNTRVSAGRRFLISLSRSSSPSPPSLLDADRLTLTCKP